VVRRRFSWRWEGVVERHKGRGPEVEATTHLTVVHARLSNGQSLLKEHLGWLVPETIARVGEGKRDDEGEILASIPPPLWRNVE
jgi:hypothetical protein